MKKILSAIIVAITVFLAFYFTLGICEGTFDLNKWMRGDWQSVGIFMAFAFSSSIAVGIIFLIIENNPPT